MTSARISRMDGWIIYCLCSRGSQAVRDHCKGAQAWELSPPRAQAGGQGKTSTHTRHVPLSQGMGSDYKEDMQRAYTTGLEEEGGESDPEA